MIVAIFDRIRKGKPVVEADHSLSHAANFLWMLNGEKPSDTATRTFDIALILHADHELNASTFAARVIAATLADIHSAITGAIGALKGPLHGGANEATMHLLYAIDKAGADPVDYVKQMFAEKKKISGFGHRVYHTEDPRATHLRRMSGELGKAAGNTKWFDHLPARSRLFVKQEKKLNANVDFYSASTYTTLGIDIDLFTPIFAISRISGWAAHVLEQHDDNRLIRPRADYVGPAYPAPYIPVLTLTANAATDFPPERGKSVAALFSSWQIRSQGGMLMAEPIQEYYLPSRSFFGMLLAARTLSHFPHLPSPVCHAARIDPPAVPPLPAAGDSPTPQSEVPRRTRPLACPPARLQRRLHLRRHPRLHHRLGHPLHSRHRLQLQRCLLVDATIPIYMYRLAESLVAPSPPDATARQPARRTRRPDPLRPCPVPAFAIPIPGHAAVTAPSGDETYGLTTGRCTFDLNNLFERTYGRFTPILELGLGDSSTLVNRIVNKHYTSLGPLSHFQLGLAVDLPTGLL